MSDVTIMELGDGALVVRMLGHHDLVLLPEVAAALREHFVAVHDAALVAEREQGVKVILTMDEAVKVKAAMESVERLGAERDAAREQLAAAEAVFAELRAAYPPTNSELYMEGGSGPFVDKGMEGYVEAFAVVHSILSGYPVSPTHTEEADRG